MPDLPISGLAAQSNLLAGDEFGINQSLSSFKVNYQQILALPRIDVLISGTPFSTATIGRQLNAVAAVTMTTMTSVEADQLAIENGTQWGIWAEIGAVTVAEGAGVTLEYYDGSSITTGSKVVPIGAFAVVTKIDDETYRITTNESAGGGGSPGLEIIQNINETLSAGGQFQSTTFDIDLGDYFIIDIMFTKPGGDQVSLDFDLTGDMNLVNFSLDDQVNISSRGRIQMTIAIHASGDYVVVADGMFFENVSQFLSRDSFISSSPITGGGGESTSLTIDENIFSDDYQLTGYIAKVL